MTPLTNYTTAELERLTTLTEATAKPGEFVHRADTTYYRTTERVVSKRGCERSPVGNDKFFYGNGPFERRVTSFTDPTPLDPPQADLLAELARRKAPTFKVGDLVWAIDRALPVTKVTPDYVAGKPAYEVQGWMWLGHELRPATDAEIAAYHRLHCVKPVASPPPPITNATHAGRTVRWCGHTLTLLSEYAVRELPGYLAPGHIVGVDRASGEFCTPVATQVSLVD